MRDKIVVIIPSLNPDEKLMDVVRGLTEEGFHKLLLVDDGSDLTHKGPFQQAQDFAGCKILTHEINKGKGSAMKTAFSFVLEQSLWSKDEILGVIVVDGDNQHKTSDILACCEAMEKTPDQVIMGCRNFREKNIPFRSRMGNTITRYVMQYACGVKISDTQTGLRAIPFDYLEDMLAVPGERYEYETNMLLSFREKGILYREVSIETVYIEDNQSSHFHPLRDSFRIYRVIFAFLSSSLLSSVLDLSLYTLFLFLLPQTGETEARIVLATVFARIISSLFNFLMNQKFVFRKKGNTGVYLLKYYILCALQMLASAYGVRLVVDLLGLGKIASILIKLVVDTILYFLSFYIQRNWVFASSAKRPMGE